MTTEDLYVAKCLRTFPSMTAGVAHERDCEECVAADRGDPVDELLQAALTVLNVVKNPGGIHPTAIALWRLGEAVKPFGKRIGGKS